jgi:hypothetical protein
LRGVSKDGPGRLRPILRDAAKEAAPQDEGSVGLAKIAGRCVHALALSRGRRRGAISPPRLVYAMNAAADEAASIACVQKMFA